MKGYTIRNSSSYCEVDNIDHQQTVVTPITLYDHFNLSTTDEPSIMHSQPLSFQQLTTNYPLMIH